MSLIEPGNPTVPLVRQCALLQLNRSTYYDQQNRTGTNREDMELMKEIDKLYLKYPYFGSRKMAKKLSRELNNTVNRKRIQRLMRLMEIAAVQPKRNLSKSAPGHEIYPYRLKGVKAGHPNHIWGADITYIPLSDSFMYLVAILDWYSRYVLAWELADTMRVEFCIQALQTALRIGQPTFHNSDQGSQFTSQAYLGLLKSHPGIQISMDGRGRCMDNIFTERLWKNVKYEEVYLHSYQSPAEARASLAQYLHDYNHERPHASLGYLTPAEVYFGSSKLS
jgi:putative transposase